MTEQTISIDQDGSIKERIDSWEKGWQALDAELPSKEDLGNIIVEVGACSVADLEKIIEPYLVIVSQIKKLNGMLTSEEVRWNHDYFLADERVKRIIDRAWALEEILKAVMTIITLRKSLPSVIDTL